MRSRTYEYYKEEFEKRGRSPIDIAEEWGTYPNKIRRELKKLGFRLRNKSEAQSNALRSGRHKHPTKGLKRSKAVKDRISEAMAADWANMPEVVKDWRIDLAKENWVALTEQQKEDFKSAAHRALRLSAKEGSKLEKYLFEALTGLDYNVEFHASHILPGETLHTDLYIPGLKIVIEVDGPSHFMPIWGDETLHKVQTADHKKNKQLRSYGLAVIRIKHITKNLSDVKKRRLLDRVVEQLEKLRTHFSNKNVVTLEV